MQLYQMNNQCLGVLSLNRGFFHTLKLTCQLRHCLFPDLQLYGVQFIKHGQLHNLQGLFQNENVVTFMERSGERGADKYKSFSSRL